MYLHAGVDKLQLPTSRETSFVSSVLRCFLLALHLSFFFDTNRHVQCKAMLDALRNFDYKVVEEAETLGEIVKIVENALPFWTRLGATVGLVTSYISYYKIRYMINRWRRRERNRMYEKYSRIEQEDRCEVADISDATDAVDPTAVSLRDLDEFHMALGLRRPRDNDLIEKVDKMILTDVIPDGWILYRTSQGYIRFRNQSTESLSFFHGGAKVLEGIVRIETSQRNAKEIEKEFPQLAQMSNNNNAASQGQGLPKLNFETTDEEIAAQSNEEKEFSSILRFFINKEKEQAIIEQEVCQSFRQTKSLRNQALTPSLRVSLKRLPPLKLDAITPQKDMPFPSATTPRGSTAPPKNPPTPRRSGSMSLDGTATFTSSSSMSGVRPKTPTSRGPSSSRGASPARQ